MWLNIIIPPQESLNFFSLIKNSETLSGVFVWGLNFKSTTGYLF